MGLTDFESRVEKSRVQMRLDFINFCSLSTNKIEAFNMDASDEYFFFERAICYMVEHIKDLREKISKLEKGALNGKDN